MNIFKKIFIVFIMILFIDVVNAKTTSILNLDDADKICEAIKDNSTMKIGIFSYYDSKNYDLTPESGKCVNTNKYPLMESQIKKGTPWTHFLRYNYSKKVYHDNSIVKYENEYGKYSPIYIASYSKSNGIDRNHTLNPWEKVFFTLNFKAKNVKGNTYKDIRLIMNIDCTNSILTGAMAYFVIADGKAYGPYTFEDASIEDVLNTDPNNSSTQMTIYKVVSPNLAKDIPASAQITQVKVYPFYNYDIHNSNIRLYSIDLNGYDTAYSKGKKYSKVSSLENTIRHKIVNNMAEEGTIKWNVSSTSPDLTYYHHYNTSPVVITKNEKFIYGVPYVNKVNVTMDKYINNCTKNKNASKSTTYYSCNYPSKYLTDITTITGKNIKKGTSVGKMLYVFEKGTKDNNLKQDTNRYKDSHNPNINYIDNKDYVFGLDCSSSTFLAVARELPYTMSHAYSHRYYADYETSLLGGLSVSAFEVEKYLRKNNIIDKKTEFSEDLYVKYYVKYLTEKYKDDVQKVYNAYGIAKPGDIIDTLGHVRLVSGYPYIVCNKNNKVFSKGSYKNNGCANYGGINPSKSYIITTEVGGSYTVKEDDRHIKQSDTGWTISFNKNITDLTSIDQLYTKSNNLKSIMHFNRKYVFSELFNAKKSQLYLPFRYNELDRAISANTLEVPSVKLKLDKSYSNINQGFYDKTAEFKKLQGVIVSNYLISAVKIVINNKTTIIYPNQTNKVSLSYGINNDAVLSAIKNLNYNNQNNISISVKTGPSVSSVLKAAGADSSGYIEVVNTKGLTANLPVETNSISLDSTSITLEINQTKKMNVTFDPTNVTNKLIKWTSSGSSVAKVDQDGLITALKTGEVTITATTRDTGKTASVKVKVIRPVTALTLSKTTTTINVGKTEKIAYTIEPSNATDKTVKWTSSDTTIATVSSSGTITGKKAGTAVITGTTNSKGKTATITVTVVNPTIKATGISTKSTTTINVGKTEKLSVSFTPSNTTNKTVTWKSNNTAVATVDSTGLVKGIKSGVATITVTSQDGNFTAKCIVNVVTPTVKVTGLKLNKTKTTITVGKTEKITPTITPTNATNKTLTWKSSDTTVAIVTSSGTIKGKKAGTATITVTSADNSEVVATLVVTVKKAVIKPTGIKLKATKLSLSKGEDVFVESEVEPSNATNKKIEWKSSNEAVATVDALGNVHAVGPGSATITATITGTDINVTSL